MKILIIKQRERLLKTVIWSKTVFLVLTCFCWEEAAILQLPCNSAVRGAVRIDFCHSSSLGNRINKV